ncbi:MAG: hypothetical protein H7138_19785, partial [Myxococcales bacterium]|nr:hypothetical protein [Myxococcales bacterium]
MTTVYLNGAYVDKERALIPVEDRGFTFGDGIYEGVRAIRGRLFQWDAHAARMAHGLAGLRIAFDATQVAALGDVCARLIRDNRLDDSEAFLYLAVTRGAPPRGTAGERKAARSSRPVSPLSRAHTSPSAAASGASKA